MRAELSANSEREMAAFPPARHIEVGVAQVLTFSASLRLGEFVRLRLRPNRFPLLHSSSQKLLCSKAIHRIKNFWCDGALLLKGGAYVTGFCDALFAEHLSCSLFFSKKEDGNQSRDSRNPSSLTSRDNFFRGRLLSTILLATNVMVFAAQMATSGKLTLWGAKINSLIDQGQFWRLVTSSFLHANIGHLLVNSYSLNSIGPVVEKVCGSRRFLAIYFTSMITSSAMSYFFCKAPAIGASGAIFGLVGSFAVYVTRHRNLIGGGKDELQHIAYVIALNMVIGFVSKGIDNWGHLGGLIGGAAMSWFLGPAWTYNYKSSDGRLVFADKAPIFGLLNRNRRVP